MKDKIVTAVIEDMETGEKFDMGELYFFPTGFEMKTIVLVKDVKSYDPFPDGSIQVDIACKALDSSGMVFDIETIFIRHTHEEKTALLFDITTNSVYIFCGQYGVDDNGLISLTDPNYYPVEPDFNEDEVREAFRVNEAHRRNIASILNKRHSNVSNN